MNSKKKFNKKNSHLTQSTRNYKKNDNYSDGEEITYSKDIFTSISADKTIQTKTDQGATATYELDTAFDRDTQATFERAAQLNKEMKNTRGTDMDDKEVYRGMNNYQQFYEKKDTAQGNASSGAARIGPKRAPSNLRATVR